MQIALPRIFATLASRTAPALAWLCVLGLGAWFAAGWYWRLASPAMSSSLSSPAADASRASQEVASRHLFGIKKDGSSDPSSAPSVDIRVLGVLTASKNGPGFAVIQDNAPGSRSILEGEEIAPNIELVRVLPLGIEIKRGGRKETISLENSSIVPAIPSALAPPSQAPNQPQSQAQPQAPQADATNAGGTTLKPRAPQKGEGAAPKNEHDPDN